MSNHAHGRTKWDAQSLTEILSFFRDLDVDPTKVRARDIDFAYSAMFGFKWSDLEIEHLRTEFLRKVGPEGGRNLCKYVLHRHPISFDGGFTTEELESLLSPCIVAIVMLLQHVDLTPDDDAALELGVTNDGVLWGQKRGGRMGHSATLGSKSRQAARAQIAARGDT